MVNPRSFWEDKILAWEENRYVRKTDETLLERVASSLSNSLRFRLVVTTRLLSPLVAGKNIIELGCGSGLIADALLAAGAASYQGYDISENAVTNGRARAARLGLADRMRFDVAEVASLPAHNGDIVFSLGLLDWLSDKELAGLFAWHGNAGWFHAIAERRNLSPQNLIHRLYVHLAYGHKTQAYVPRYFSIAEMTGFARNAGDARAIKVFRDRRLSFGALLTTLPIKA